MPKLSQVKPVRSEICGYRRHTTALREPKNGSHFCKPLIYSLYLAPH